MSSNTTKKLTGYEYVTLENLIKSSGFLSDFDKPMLNLVFKRKIESKLIPFYKDNQIA
jgi:hypothetical protein